MKNPIRTLVAALGNLAMLAAQGRTTDGTVVTKTDEEQAAAIEKQLETVEEVLATEPEITEPIEKEDELVLPPAVLALIQKATDDAAAATKAATAATARADTLEKQLTAISESQGGTDRIAKARQMLGKLPGDPAKLAAVLKTLPEDQVETLDQLCRGANAVMKFAQPFQVIGKSTLPTNPTAPVSRLEKAAKEIAVRDKCSMPVAVAKALDADPDLYAETLATEE